MSRNLFRQLPVAPLLACALMLVPAAVLAQTLPGDTTTTDTTSTEAPAPPPTEEAMPEAPVGPSISSISVTDITDTSARIDVSSDEMVQGYVEYGTTEQYGASTPLTSEFTTSPSFLLENLSPETLYHYRVVVVDSAGTAAITGDETFTTLPPSPEATEGQGATPEPEAPPPSQEEATTTAATTTPASETPAATSTEESAAEASSTPTTSPLAISNTETTYVSTSSARIMWQTNTTADSQVEYGTTNSYGSLTAVGVLSRSHSASLSSLTPSTKYYYRAISKTSSGETAYSPDETFTTLAAAAPAPPVISNATVNSVSTSTATISWTTSKPATSDIRYGTTTSYGLETGADQTLRTAHTATIGNLMSATLYHFRIIAQDSAGNTALSKDRTFTTEAVSASTSPSEALSTSTVASSSEEILSNIAAQAAQATGSAPSGGGGLPVAPTHPLLLTVTPLDGEVSFDWRKDSGVQNGTIHTVIVKKEGADPVRSRIDGTIIYDGPSTTFTDTDVQNGVEYHYALYSYGAYGRFTAAARFKVVPQTDKEQVNISAAEATTDTAPVLVRDLHQGKQGDDVSTLQTYLSDSGYYPEGLITGYFGPLTHAAVVRYQTLNDIAPAAGYVGPITRGVLGQ